MQRQPHLSDAHKEKISKSNRGKIRSEEHKQLLREKRTGTHLSETTKMKIREWHLTHVNKVFTNTKIELKMKEMLDKLGVYYIQQYPLEHIARVDFYIPDKLLVIECDGCFYHACHQCGFTKYHQDKIAKDSNKTSALQKLGYSVLRFWGHEINTMSILQI